MSISDVFSKEPESRAAEPRAELGPSELSLLYERYQKEVFHLALRYGRGNPSWAEDITQDVFLRLFRLRTKLHDHEALSGWFYRVTTRRCLNKLRHEALVSSVLGRLVWGELVSGGGAEAHTPETQALVKDELSRAFEAVNRLPIKERAAFFMLHVDGKPQQEIAAVLGHSKGYVSKLLKRATATLVREGFQVNDG